MIPRRQVLGGALAGGVLGALAEPEVEAAAQSSDRVDLAPIVRALNDLRSEVRAQRQFVEIATLREAQLAFLRSNGKLPDYIDVGTEHWFCGARLAHPMAAAAQCQPRRQRPAHSGADVDAAHPATGSAAELHEPAV